MIQVDVLSMNLTDEERNKLLLLQPPTLPAALHGPVHEIEKYFILQTLLPLRVRQHDNNNNNNIFGPPQSMRYTHPSVASTTTKTTAALAPPVSPTVKPMQLPTPMNTASPGLLDRPNHFNALSQQRHDNWLLTSSSRQPQPRTATSALENVNWTTCEAGEYTSSIDSGSYYPEPSEMDRNRIWRNSFDTTDSSSNDVGNCHVDEDDDDDDSLFGLNCLHEEDENPMILMNCSGDEEGHSSSFFSSTQEGVDVPLRQLRGHPSLTLFRSAFVVDGSYDKEKCIANTEE
jgi:hypothetical protein